MTVNLFAMIISDIISLPTFALGWSTGCGVTNNTNKGATPKVAASGHSRKANAHPSDKNDKAQNKKKKKLSKNDKDEDRLLSSTASTNSNLLSNNSNKLPTHPPNKTKRTRDDLSGASSTKSTSHKAKKKKSTATFTDPSAEGEGGTSLPKEPDKPKKGKTRRPGKPPKQNRNIDMPSDEDNENPVPSDDALMPKDKLGNTISSKPPVPAKKDKTQDPYYTEVLMFLNKPKISDTERQEWGKLKSVVWVALPEIAKGRNNFLRLGRYLTELTKVGAEHHPKVTKLMATKNTFYMLFCTSIENANQLVSVLKGCNFNPEDPNAKIAAEIFGDGKDDTLWITFCPGYEDPDFDQAIRQYIDDHITTKGLVRFDIPDFGVKEKTLNGIGNSEYLIYFKSKVRWCGPTLHIGGKKRTIRSEGRHCTMCGKHGHNGWDCKALPSGQGYRVVKELPT